MLRSAVGLINDGVFFLPLRCLLFFKIIDLFFGALILLHTTYTWGRLEYTPYIMARCIYSFYIFLTELPSQIQKFIQSIDQYFGRFAMSKHYQYHLHRRAEQLKHAQPIIERRWSSVQHAILSRNTFQ